MLPKNIFKLKLKNLFYLPIFLLLFFATQSYAQQSQQSPVSTISAQDIIVNIVSQLPNLMRMVTAIAYVMGMFFIIRGLIDLKHFGESRTMMSSEHGLKGPLVYLIVGTLLLYLPTAVQVGISTFWANPNPYGYTQMEDQWTEFINDVFLVVQFIGTIAFIRGLVILSHLGSSHGGQDSLAKGLTHIIGGIFCINVYQFVQVVMATLGIQT